MFNDELERVLLEERQHSMSIQAWAARISRDPHRPLWRRLLRGIGSGLIASGSSLMRRFGESDQPQPDDYIPSPHDQRRSHAYN